jgi:dihydrolipoamide dehydrogenase
VPRSVPGIEFGGRIVGTEEAWAFAALPERLAVVGAGASGAEIASAYARLGSETYLFEVLDRVLPTEDVDISKLVGRGLQRQGIKLHTGTAITDVKSTKTGVSLASARRRSRSTGS